MNNSIGGSGPGEGNLISGNGDAGIVLRGSANLVQGNYVGTDVTGTSAIPNGFRGIEVRGQSNTVGGAGEGGGNLISGNDGPGVDLQGMGHVAEGNLIGTDINGISAIPNMGSGVSMGGSGHSVGGATSDSGNVISGNDFRGISYSAGDTTIRWNLIGTDATGTAALGNGAGGIATVADGGSILDNTIAYNGGVGMGLDPGASLLTIRDNSIHSNADIGIDLGLDGVTPNDPRRDDDADTGANGL